jgi:hypothetical protein
MRTYGPKLIVKEWRDRNGEMKREEHNVMPLSESSINQLLDHGKTGMVMISGERSAIDSENPKLSLRPDFEKYLDSIGGYDAIDSDALYDEEQNWLKRRNAKADKVLLKYIQDAGYSYSKTYGEYKGEYEPSYIVYNYKKGDDNPGDFYDLEQFAIAMCKKFKQESVLVKRPNDPPIFLDGDGNYVEMWMDGGIKINRPEEDFKTYPKRRRSGPFVTFTEERRTRDYAFENMYTPLRPASYNENMRRRKSGEYIL